MRAVVIDEGRLVVGERPEPVPGTGDVLIRVRERPGEKPTAPQPAVEPGAGGE